MAQIRKGDAPQGRQQLVDLDHGARQIDGLLFVERKSGELLVDPVTLEPLESDNIDLSLEYYFGDASYVSAGFFHKKVKNFIGQEVTTEGLFGITDGWWVYLAVYALFIGEAGDPSMRMGFDLSIERVHRNPEDLKPAEKVKDELLTLLGALFSQPPKGSATTPARRRRPVRSCGTRSGRRPPCRVG